MRRRAVALLMLAAAGAAGAQNTSLAGDDDQQILVVGKRPIDPCYVARQVFVSPVGQPFRGPVDEPAPVARWFAEADANRDGRIDAGEMRADADRWFAKVDTDRNGEIAPAEMAVYENATVREVSIYDRTGMDRARADKARKARKPVPYGTPVGAARFALLNIPHPLASADADDDRGITRPELEAVAARAFAQLAQGGSALTLAALPDTPQVKWMQLCAKKHRRPKRTPPQ